MIGSGLTLPVAFSRVALAADKPTLVNSLRSLSNPYHAAWNKGGEVFAKAMGLDYVTLATEGDSEKGIADIRAMPANTGGNAVVNIDPNDAADAPPIVEARAKAGDHIVTQWNKPAGLHPVGL
jgi:ribose transport system substrate-binding protein